MFSTTIDVGPTEKVCRQDVLADNTDHNNSLSSAAQQSPIILRSGQQLSRSPSFTAVAVVFSMKRFMKRKRKEVNTKEDGVIAVKRIDMENHVGAGLVEVFNTNLTNHTKETKSYEKRKKEIFQEEYANGWDSAARKSASETEIKAAEIVFKIREDERDHLFGNKASEAIPGPDTLDMGGQFLTNKQRIEGQSKLFQIAKRMPKGCHLHLHFNAELTPKMLIDKANEMPNMFIRSTQPLLTPEAYIETEIVFEVRPADTPVADIFSPDYKPEWKKPDARPWMPWSKFREEFTRRRIEGNEEPSDAEEWIRAKMVLDEDEVYNKSQTTNGIWARFNQATRAFKGLMNYESVYRWYISEAIDSMIHDKVMYTELRPMLMDKSIPRDDGIRRLDHVEQMKLIESEVAKKQDELKSTGSLDKFPFGLKVIYCAPRSIPKEWMQREIRDCIQLKQKFPSLVCGFDLVGAEDRPNHIGFYRDELLSLVKTCTELKLDIPFMFHAGETLLDTGGSKNPANSNLYDAVLLNAKRIGHGFSLLKHPVLIEAFRKQNICIELCPTSNELLHLCRNIKEHPYPQILAQGIECTVNSDNPSLFRGDVAYSNSVSHEFYQIMVGSPSMSVHGWRQLVEWSVKHSCLTDREKLQAYDIVKREWEEFCLWVVQEFGEYAAGLKVEL